MNWCVKFTYILVKPLPKDVPIEVYENIITDDLSKIKFPPVDNDYQFQGYDYRLVSIEITPCKYKIIV